MKKETVIKRLTTYHNTMLEPLQKIKDYLYTIDDPELCELVDEWCDGIEEFFDDGNGSIESLIETIEDIFDEADDDE